MYTMYINKYINLKKTHTLVFGYEVSKYIMLIVQI